MLGCNSDNSTEPNNNNNNNTDWTQTSFPSGLNGDWYNSSGVWIFGKTGSVLTLIQNKKNTTKGGKLISY